MPIITVGMFLIESSHLDNEVKISEQIKHLEMTRVIIAHRPETIKQAQRVLIMHQGKVYTPEELQKLTGTVQ